MDRDSNPRSKSKFNRLAYGLGLWTNWHGLILVLFLGSLVTPALAQTTLTEITIEAANGLADDYFSEIDILFVYDADLLNQLPFTQFDWISGKEAFLERDDNLLELVHTRVDSNTLPHNVELPDRISEAIGVLVFASHEDPVAEALDISFETRILLQIESYGINVVQK